MARHPFVHLHVHSEYSLLDGAARIGEMVQRAAELGMPALALTDHGVLYGAVEFFKACKEAGIKPLIGCEIYLAPRSRHDRTPRVDDRLMHLLLLVENERGYRNLLKIVSRAYLEGFYHKPRADLELLAEHGEGLIATSACLSGPVAKHLAEGRPEEAERWLRALLEIFGTDRFYLEVQDHGLAEERRAYRGVVELARRYGVPLVVSNDSHYLRQADARVQDVLVCIQSGKTLRDAQRLKFENDQFYLKSPEEMEALFGAELPEALGNTLRIAERCSFELETGTLKLPPFEVPEGHTPASYLRRLCEERLPRRYPRVSEEVRARLDYELQMIERMGFPGYFLIVWDFVEFARSRGIPVGPGRGSAAGSIVSYLLGITNVDPIRHNLLFERFLNPERVSPPDIDIDFCFERRDEVIDYVVRKYGQDRVAQIITFGTMAARAAIRDVGRVLGMPYGEVDRIAKLVPAQIGITLEEALRQSPELMRAVEQDERVRELVELARAIEGMPRHASVHAAGVVITPGPLMDYVPLQRMNDGTVVTQFDWTKIEEVGLLKMDFLGLRTLTVMEETRRIVRETEGVEIDFDRVPLDDAKTYELLCRGETANVFQLESGGMREMLRELRPSSIEDVIAAVALYRPGPMQFIPDFVRNKHEGNVRYPHPDLEPILRETYGIMVYQEQVMQVASKIAGFSLGKADILRRAIGKKNRKLIDEMKQEFIEGSIKNGYDRELAEQIYDMIERFANYGFNKSHSAPYGLLAYLTAYLKAHHPVAYMAATLTSFLNNTDKIAEAIAECARMGIKVLPPDVNESEAGFTVVRLPEGGRGIRFGLAAIKNVGVTLIEAVVAERRRGGPFRSLRDFCERVDHRLLNRRALESMVKAGAFDSLGARRAQLLQVLEATLHAGVQRQRERLEGQVSLLDLMAPGTARAAEAAGGAAARAPGGAPPAGSGAGAAAAPWAAPVDLLPEVEELPLPRLLQMEKEVLGIYLSGHPLAGLEHDLLAQRTASAARVRELADGVEVTLAGLCTGLRQVSTRTGEPMAFFTLEDLDGQVEVVVRPRAYREAQFALAEDAVVVVEGRVSWQDEQARVVAERVARLVRTAKVYLRLDEARADGDLLGRLRTLLAKYPGPTPVYLYFERARRMLLTARQSWVTWTPELEERLSALLGPGCARLEAGDAAGGPDGDGGARAAGDRPGPADAGTPAPGGGPPGGAAAGALPVGAPGAGATGQGAPAGRGPAGGRLA